MFFGVSLSNFYSHLKEKQIGNIVDLELTNHIGFVRIIDTHKLKIAEKSQKSYAIFIYFFKCNE